MPKSAILWLAVGSIPLALGCDGDDADTTGGDAAEGSGSTSGGESTSTSAATTAATTTSGTSSTSTSTTSGGSTSGDTGSTGGAASYVCTQVIGYSQVNQWYTAAGNFESVVDDAAWQLLWRGGAGVDRWQDPNFDGWDRAIVSPCDVGGDAPDRVILSVSGPYGDDEQAWADAIQASIDTIRDKIPTATVIALQPVVGGPGHMPCMNGNNLVRASWQHEHIDNAIAMVVGGDVVAGFSPEVRDCNDYRDSLGHLTDEGAEAAGLTIGDAYAN